MFIYMAKIIYVLLQLHFPRYENRMEKLTTQMDYLMKICSELRIKMNQISKNNDTV